MNRKRSQRRHSAAFLTIVVGAALALLGQDFLSSQVRPPGDRRTEIVDGREVAAGEVLVRYRENLGALEQRRAEFQTEADEVEPIGRRGARRVRSRLSTRAMLEVLRANPDVEFVEPNYVLRSDALPDDPFFEFLWGLRNVGQTIGGSPGLVGTDISAPLAWDITTGSRAVVVGVVDSGIDYNHPDLAANVWTAPRSFSVTIGGVVINCAAGTHGFNAITRTCNPLDDHYHGTHVAGTIGAVGNNGIGVAGVNWSASMMGLKFLDSTGHGLTSDAIAALEFAIQAKAVLGADANVRVLSNSWGGTGSSQSLRNQIEAANAADMLFVAAAGNDSLNNDIYPTYPASFATANMIAVASMTNTNARSSFSNYGANSIHLGAPGSSILSTVPNNGYAYLSGTSMATPHVAGAAALILAACPVGTAQLKSTILSAVDPTTGMAGITTTGGRLNVNTAIRSCANAPTVVATLAGSTITVDVTGGPGNVRDWLGLYCPAVGADSAYRDWKYLNNSQSPPGAGLSSATVTFAAPRGGSSCNVRLFSNNSLNKLATSLTVPIAAETPTLTATTPTVNAGGTINVSLVNGPGNRTDWAALFPANAPDTAGQQWIYLNGLRTPPATGVASATLQFVAPSGGGNYNVRLFESDGFTKLATSGLVTVSTPPAITVADATVTEGNSGTTAAVFTVRLSPPNPTQNVTVFYSTANDTATASENDYQVVNGTLTFTPGASIANITVPVIGDTTFEPNERFFFNLSLPVNAVITDAQGIGSILNDDVAPVPGIVRSGVGPQIVGDMINLNVVNGPGNRLDWVAVFDANAPDTAGRNWAYLNSSRTPPATGLTSALVSLAAVSAPGNYNLRFFANDGFTKLATSPTFAVQPRPTMRISDVSVTEGNAGTTSATFTVTLSPVSPLLPVTVDYSTWDHGTATVGVDYQHTSGTLTFAPNVATQTLTVAINGDTNFEGNEVFFVDLSNISYPGVLGDPQGNGFILNDDAGVTPTITLNTPVNIMPGGNISITVQNGPANTNDWVGLFSTAANDSSWVSGQYLNGQPLHPPYPGLSTAVLSFVAPQIPGTYNVRLLAGDGLMTRLATSVTINVAAFVGASVSNSASTILAGAPFTSTVSNGPGAQRDWVGLFPTGASDTGYVEWYYLNGAKTAPASGLTAATVYWTAPLAPGTYNVRYFYDNGFTKLATSGVLTVAAP